LGWSSLRKKGKGEGWRHGGKAGDWKENFELFLLKFRRGTVKKPVRRRCFKTVVSRTKQRFGGNETKVQRETSEGVQREGE